MALGSQLSHSRVTTSMYCAAISKRVSCSVSSSRPKFGPEQSALPVAVFHPARPLDSCQVLLTATPVLANTDEEVKARAAQRGVAATEEVHRWLAQMGMTWTPRWENPPQRPPVQPGQFSEGSRRAHAAKATLACTSGDGRVGLVGTPDTVRGAVLSGRVLARATRSVYGTAVLPKPLHALGRHAHLLSQGRRCTSLYLAFPHD